MKKKINIEIKDKIITKKDLLMFSKIFWETYSKSKSEHKKITFNFDCDEGTSNYEIENAKLEAEVDFLDTKKINAISMCFVDYRSEKRIELSLSHGTSGRKNQLKIKDDSNTWADTIFNKFKEKIEALKPQSNRFGKYYKLFFHICSLNVGFMMFKLINFFLNFVPIRKVPYEELNRFFQFLKDTPIILDIFILVFSWIWGMSLIGGRFHRIESLWPSIEFDFGPDHFKKEKNNRKALRGIGSLTVIPLILQLIFRLSTK